MPALPNVPGVIEYKHTATLNEDADVVNRYYVRYTGTPPTTGGLIGQLAVLATDWSTVWGPYFASNYVLKEMTATDLTSPTSGAGIWSGALAGGWSTTGDVPGGAAARLNFITGRRYRGGHSGIYVPVTASNMLSDAQTLYPPWVTDIKNAWINWMSDIGTTMPSGTTYADQCTVSYYHGATPFTRPSGRVVMIPTLRVSPVVDDVLNVLVNPRVASQRRRNLTRS